MIQWKIITLPRVKLRTKKVRKQRIKSQGTGIYRGLVGKEEQAKDTAESRCGPKLA